MFDVNFFFSPFNLSTNGRLAHISMDSFHAIDLDIEAAILVSSNRLFKFHQVVKAYRADIETGKSISSNFDNFLSNLRNTSSLRKKSEWNL